MHSQFSVCLSVCHALFFKHNLTLLHEFRWKIVDCRAYRSSIDASGDSTYEACDETVKSETVELNLQHTCETDKDKYSLVAANEAIHTRHFLCSSDINMECMQQELSLIFSI